MNAMFAHRLYVHPTLANIGLALRLAEPLLLLACALLAYVVRTGTPFAPMPYVGLAVMVTLAYAAVAGFSGVYRPEALRSLAVVLPRLALVGVLTFALLVVALFMFKVSSYFSRIWVGIWAIFAAASLVGLRAVVTAYISRRIAGGQLTRRIAVLGTGDRAMALLAHLRDEIPGFQLHGIYASEDAKIPSDLSRTSLYKGMIGQLVFDGLRGDYDDLIVAMDMEHGSASKGLLDTLHKLPVNVFYCLPVCLFDRGVGQLPGLGRLPLVSLFRKPLEGPGLVMKRAIDIAASGMGLVLLSPLFVGVAIAIKLSSSGPVFFRQRRDGFNGRTFEMLKFRSMRVGDAPKDASGKEQQATRSDPRITTVGRFIRRTSIDELPQLINVLQGHMSLVGPRPHVPSHNSYYEVMVDRYASRHKMKPGLTGWAQLNGLRGETDTVDKMAKRVEYDIWYVENWSLAMDLKILAFTPFVVAFQRGAY
ncbi:MAG: undecaprenyl-phosphate glucose phosphotransferase [Pseudomonadaceae bacterium]|nr:undecaprenyl-phosphate glucose phosphotransferase [Pseudomonadaceae bacterium]